jgi:hypothetical protein
MLTMRASDHVRKSRNIRGVHSCPTSTGFPSFRLDAKRLAQEEAALATRRLHRARLENLWSWHEGWCRELRRA